MGMTYNCPQCLSKDPMVKGKDRLMRQHAREVRKRPYKCLKCGAKIEEVARRYPGEAFEVHRVIDI